MAFGENFFGPVDYIVVAATFMISAGIGLYFGFYQKQTQEDLLVGGRKMGILPVALVFAFLTATGISLIYFYSLVIGKCMYLHVISMIVTYFSAASILGFPGEVYAYGTQYFFMIVVIIVFVPLSMLIFVKVFYEMQLTSVYEYLEVRFHSRWVRWLSSFCFVLQILLLNGVNLYAPAVALDTILGFPIWFSVSVVGLVCSVYTAVGGLKAVIWTDVFQFFMIFIGLGSIMVKAFINSGGVGPAFSKANDWERLQFVDWTFDVFKRHTTFNIFVGAGFTTLATYGTHQPLVQRYCSLPSASSAAKTLVSTVPLNTIAYIITLVTGIAAVATYAGCDPVLLGKISGPDAIIPYFVIEELSFIPGMMGIFVAAIFSGVLSTISSNLNSMAAVTWEDFLKKLTLFQRLSPERQIITTKLLAATYGLLSIGVAYCAQYMGTIFQMGNTAVGATNGPLGAIFFCGLFLPFMNREGAIAGIMCGFGVMMWIALESYLLMQDHNLFPRLPVGLGDCPNGTDFSQANNFTLEEVPDFKYPQKLYTLSYLMYPIIGAIITTIVGVIVSALTGGFSKQQKVQAKHLHPWIRNVGWVRPFIQDDEKVPLHESKKVSAISDDQQSVQFGRDEDGNAIARIKQGQGKMSGSEES